LFFLSCHCSVISFSATLHASLPIYLAVYYNLKANNFSLTVPWLRWKRSGQFIRWRKWNRNDHCAHLLGLGKWYHLPSPNKWAQRDRKTTRLNSSHVSISYAVFCLKK